MALCNSSMLLLSARTLGSERQLRAGTSARAALQVPPALHARQNARVACRLGASSDGYNRCSPRRDLAAKPDGSCSGPWHRPAVGAAALALLLPLADPAGAATAAAEAANHSAGYANMYWTCVGLGSTAVITTLLFTSRFLMSYFPHLERRARQQRQRPGGAAIYRALTAADPLLDPITKGIFKMTEQGDLNYGAMAVLALVSAVMSSLLGDGGLLVERVPDLTMLQALQTLMVWQHMMLLPMWCFVVFRYFLLI